MIRDAFTIHSLGHDAVTVVFGNKIDESISRKVIGFGEWLKQKGPGWINETVPGYASLTIFFDPIQTTLHVTNPIEKIIRGLADEYIHSGIKEFSETETLHEIPVSFKDQDAPDLNHVAEKADLSVKELIKIFTASEYRVYMLGFLPGFPYMGQTDRRIAIARKQTPRRVVPAGSVGLAGRQTGIYPFDSPGGWQLIGKTDQLIFDTTSDSPAMFSCGDRVRFLEA